MESPLPSSRPSDSSPPARRAKTPAESPSGRVASPEATSSSSSPRRTPFLAADRNSEFNHLDALAVAQTEHERVRKTAISVYELHELREEHRKLVQAEESESRRLRAQAEVVAQAGRLQGLRQQSAVLPAAPAAPAAPPPTTPQQQSRNQMSQPSPRLGETTTLGSSRTPPVAGATHAAPVLGTTGLLSPVITLSPPNAKPRAEPNAAAALQAKEPHPRPAQPEPPPETGTTQLRPPPTSSWTSSIANTSATASTSTIAVSTSSVSPPPAKSAAADRYLEIHRHLKMLRKNLEGLAKVPGSPLKGKLGDMRREIRKSMGQLTGEKGANTQLVSKITGVLKEALDGRLPSEPVDVAAFIAIHRDPVQGAAHNDPKLPSLFLYLVNILAKTVINQFINECGPNPRAADPIGVTSASIFSQREFGWRGGSLIDVLMAKFRVVCPVLFGARGSDRTERGRAALGWRREAGGWVPEQMHNDRMTGLGAGFAAVALRDFSKATRANPLPPTHYWTAMATLVNTPAADASATQCIVLKAMIDGFEQRFLAFYGSAALAALRVALVDFPAKISAKNSAAGALRVLGDVLRKDAGLDLG